MDAKDRDIIWLKEKYIELFSEIIELKESNLKDKKQFVLLQKMFLSRQKFDSIIYIIAGSIAGLLIAKFL